MTDENRDLDDDALITLAEPNSYDKLMEHSIHILQKPRSERQDRDIEILQQYTNRIKFFNEIRQKQGDKVFEKLHGELCMNLNYESVPAGTTLMEAGSIGTTFYIVLKGSVEVFININKTTDDGKEVMFSQKVAELKEGQAFGELAIMEDALQPRKATIKIKDHCYLATLEREPYRKILGSMVSQDLFEQTEFLVGMSIFKNAGWTKRALQNLGKCFSKPVYRRGHIVYKEGDNCDEIFILKSGEVKCTKNVQLAKANKNFVIDENNNLYPFEENPMKKIIEIAVLASGQVFGEEEALLLLTSKKETSHRLNNYLKNFDPGKEFLASSTTGDASINVLNSEDRLIYAKNSTSGDTKRETTMIITSMTAEIWRMSAKIDSYQATLNSILTTVYNRKKRREDRIMEIIENVPNQPVSNTRSKAYLKENILSFTKHKKYIGPNQPEQIIYCNLSHTVDTNKDSFDLLNDSSNLFNPHERTPRIPQKATTSSQNRAMSVKITINQPPSDGVNLHMSPMNEINLPSVRNSDLRRTSISTKPRPRRVDESLVSKSMMSHEEKTTSLLLSKKGRKILLVDNPLNNTSVGHSSSGRFSRETPQTASRITNKQNNIYYQDVENFFNNSIRVKKVIHADRIPSEASVNQSSLSPNSKSPRLSLDPRRSFKESLLLPSANKSHKPLKGEIKLDLRTRLGLRVQPVGRESGSRIQKRSADRSFIEDNRNRLRSLTTVRDNSVIESTRKTMETYGKFQDSVLNSHNSPEKEGSKKEMDSGNVIRKAIEVYRDLLMRKKRPEDFMDGHKTKNMNYSFQSCQKKKPSNIRIYDSVPMSVQVVSLNPSTRNVTKEKLKEITKDPWEKRINQRIRGKSVAL